MILSRKRVTATNTVEIESVVNSLRKLGDELRQVKEPLEA